MDELIVKLEDIEWHGRYPICISVDYPDWKPFFQPGHRRGVFATRHFELSSDGYLILSRYCFDPRREDLAPQELQYRFTGDFTVQFAHIQIGSSITVPFRNGKIDLCQDHWEFKTNLIPGQIRRKIRGGWLVDIDFHLDRMIAFLPASLTPCDWKTKIDQMASTRHDFETKMWDFPRRNLVVSLEHLSVGAG